LVEQLTLLMMRHFDSLAIEIEGQSVESQTATVPARMKRFLDEAESLIVSAIGKELNDHQLIHLQELAKNCLGAMMAVVDALLIEKPFERMTGEQTLQMHPGLCGLLCDVDAFGGHSNHQLPRVPYAPSRTGHEVTYEEIANLFRTSRVTIREIVHKGYFRKLRPHLKDFCR
jgi:hypothetical protein